MTPIENRLGIETTDISQTLNLIQVEVSELLPILLEVLSDSYSVDILSDDSVVSDRASYLAVYKFKGHDWTLLERFGGYSDISDKNLARQLSDKLHSLAITFEQSDSSGFSRYFIWENSFLEESFNLSAEGIPSEDDLELINSFNQYSLMSKLLIIHDDVIEDYGGNLPYEYNCVIYSSSRALTKSEVGEPYRFVHNTFKNIDAYIPALYWNTRDGSNIADSFSYLGSETQTSDFQEIIFLQLNPL
ncbi:hypothetical protein IQ254_17165 [Nodosilinea sp. LEGE 07088]|uniref:hypothetical protein n=1 Tax=Nodosilinea sp. LEGE 07088 TaxID=2777968 RepID=UPI001882F17C|nr:hypothetical protein [Nodosilinea sp. LEGE 07088]MBE9138901.1 hypothetical protein [Nodosilinea sp. LEGE 07088]